MKIIFFGSSGFAVPILEGLVKNEDVALVVTQPDREKGRALKVAPTAVKSKAGELGVEIFQPNQVNAKESIEFLKKFNADLFIVVSFGQILSKAILDLPKLYCLNRHASLLPKYRGAAPRNWAIANGEKETGVTIMKMNEKMDEGDILLRESVAIDAGDDAVALSDKLSKKGAESLFKAIELIKADKADFIKQDHSKATSAPKLKKDDGLIDWKMPAEEISNRIRAFAPWPGCFTYLDKKMLKIWKAKPITELVDKNAKPGAILKSDKTDILVKTGKGALNIEELQLEGSRRMTTEEFLAGHNITNQVILVL
ncbi:MAG: methionyl-tRNA formyltransferase [Candidatus Omnitrophota bacterium]|nr:methionyl-tRNA formyltransferase [Candidatus Omnitrophota bacterium]